MITWRRALTLLSVAFVAALFAALVVRLRPGSTPPSSGPTTRRGRPACAPMSPAEA
jgi:hypothetical protein